jgi:Thrombospondin type 3 repeat
VVGCYAPEIPSGGPCTTACPGGEICIAGRCHTEGERDADVDGVPDELDNCIETPNGAQHDEDHDGAGDTCDPCPHVAGVGAAQFADADQDGVGDGCDPAPKSAKQAWVLFDPFTGPPLPHWTNPAAARFGDDKMTLTDANLRLEIATGELHIVVAGQLSSPGAVPRKLSLALGKHTDGSYYYAEAYETAVERRLKITKYDGAMYANAVTTALPDGIPAGAFRWELDQSVAEQRVRVAAEHAATAYGPIEAATMAPALFPTANLELGTSNLTATYDYIAVIRTVP